MTEFSRDTIGKTELERAYDNLVKAYNCYDHDKLKDCLGCALNALAFLVVHLKED